MTSGHILDALTQVERLREVILERRAFRGFSGEARWVSGAAALAGAVLLSGPWVPRTAAAHLAVWAGVLAVAMGANYAALVSWFLNDPVSRRDLLSLKPAVDVIPALAVGGLLSIVLVRAGLHDRLFGTWMCCYGLAHACCRISLPRANYTLGLAYLACGAALLLAPGIRFLNPWPMGLVFGAGEGAGGWILVTDRRRAAREAREESHESD